MNVDSIISAANLAKYKANYGFITDIFEPADRTSIINTLVHLNAHGCTIDYKKETSVYTFDQVSFFNFMDWIALLKMRQQVLDHYWRFKDATGFDVTRNKFLFFKDQDIDPVAYFDEYDVQPFRKNVFNSNRATLELFRIMSMCGANDDKVIINNFDYAIEFAPPVFKRVLYYISYWLEWYVFTKEYYYETRGRYLNELDHWSGRRNI